VVVDSGKAGVEGTPSRRSQPIYPLTTAPFFCSTKQLSFFLWSLERVKGIRQAGLRSQPAMTWLINPLPLSL
jgi:hypothetical protein